MILLDWLAENDVAPEHCYAIIDPLAANQPLIYWFAHATSTDAWPLYAGTRFANDIDSSPWLLPLQDWPDWQSWWQAQEADAQATGIIVISKTPAEQLVKHWQSLLVAGLDGEEVLFRYYDPRILGPMLYTWTDIETRQFMGPTDYLVVWMNNDWVISSPYPDLDMTVHADPWWRMRPEHFIKQPGERDVMIQNVDTWLWENYSSAMAEWLQHHDSVKAALSDGYLQMQQYKLSDVWKPAWLILYLFGYSTVWPSIETRIARNESDEQTDLMHDVMHWIIQQKQ